MPPGSPTPGNVAGFRWKLLLAMGVVVSALTALGIYAAERNATASAENDFQQEFQAALAALHHVQEIRSSEIARRNDALVRNPRIHAALEDDALDLLYPIVKDQLHDLIDVGPPRAPTTGGDARRATFYRFLDVRGAIIPPPDDAPVGELTPREEKQLALGALPSGPQMGYLVRSDGGKAGAVNEVLTVPIVSTQTGEEISALLVGFEPVELNAPRTGAGARIRNGIWVGGGLRMAGLSEKALAQLNEQVGRVIRAVDGPERRFSVEIEGSPHLVFYKELNPASVFPPAYEVCIYPLAESLAARRRLRQRIGGLGALVLLGALAASLLVARRLAVPVEQLASDSVENWTQRRRAEAALEVTSLELQRAARFSADASHQLKTPVTVLRAGLEELLSHDHLPPETRDEISALVYQTYRLNGVIEDLLLLSRMDAGRLRLEIGAVDLTRLVEAWLDDLSALPDPLRLRVDTELPPGFCIAGEQRYTTLIVQNLLENARKYNRTDGRIRVTARPDGQDSALLTIGNTGPPIPLATQEHIFERFHRGTAGENVPGHGLGLNLARELARIHGGDLRLARSAEDWTEFEVRFRVAG